MKHKEKEDKAKIKIKIKIKIVVERTIQRLIEKHARIKFNSTWFMNVIKVVDDHFDNNFHVGL
jgi:hypothetical protein